MATAWDRLAALPAKCARDTFTAIVTTYTFSAGGTDTNVSAVFDNLPEALPLEIETAFSGSLPTLDVILSDLSQAPKQGDTLVLNGTTYEVSDVQLDGLGNALLALVE